MILPSYIHLLPARASTKTPKPPMYCNCIGTATDICSVKPFPPSNSAKPSLSVVATYCPQAWPAEKEPTFIHDALLGRLAIGSVTRRRLKGRLSMPSLSFVAACCPEALPAEREDAFDHNAPVVRIFVSDEAMSADALHAHTPPRFRLPIRCFATHRPTVHSESFYM